jgi:hypothetical protein
MTSQEKNNEAIKLVQRFVPNYSVSLKKDSKLQRLIGWILAKVGNKKYMDSFCTTIGQSTTIPDKEWPGLWAVLLHEGRHAQDSLKMSNGLFGLAYLMPQLIGILGVVYTLVILTGLIYGWPLWLLWGCVSLLFLAPLPAPFRAYAELRGYTVSLAVDYWSNEIFDEERYLDWLAGVFSGPDYYFMWTFKGMVRRHFQKVLQQLKDDTFKMDEYLMECEALSIRLLANQ